MKNRTFCVLLALGLGLSGASSDLRAAVAIKAEGDVPVVSTVTATIKNGTEIKATYASGSTSLSFPQYLEVNFNCSRVGYQALIVSTDNSSAAANPKYTGTGSGSGLVYLSNKTQNAALHWVVFDSPVTGGYTFVPGTDPVAEPIKTANQFFIVDQKERVSNPADPFYLKFPAGYASFVFGLRQLVASLANAPDPDRKTIDGKVYVYLGANVRFRSAGIYKTNTLKIQLVTINDDKTFTEHAATAAFTVTATR